MRTVLRQRLLLAARTDAHAVFNEEVWTTRCLHCRRVLQLRADGEPLGAATLEHVVPQSWFGMASAQALTARVGGDADDPRNLALACASCNHGKGRHHDANGPRDARAIEVVTALLDKRLQRWRDA
ncbi:HNH endonuclease [Pseudoxanthomonas sp. JBR18]|uniref:HNH endonuclease n=1 Tax=Pseudoxanthomonas sp. JBR18 TaxID=2969308 RepID=UPI0023050500|nr:HNH endonuclease [Pseudoxanthomonas sp. JBR18]WCE02925.1 HNH endonuclease [Pseudoxanthomonas sp. JBR18]